MTSKKWTDLIGFMVAMAFFVSFAFSMKALAETKIFQDITEQSGLTSTPRNSVAFGDFDNDGLVDLLTPNALFKNTSAAGRVSFKDVTSEAGLQSMNPDGQPTFADFNNDGLLDFANNYGQLFMQIEKGQFVELSQQMGFRLDEPAHVLSIGDLDRDGFVDIIAGSNENYEKSQFFAPRVFRNSRGESFSDVSALIRFDQFPAYARGIVWGDFNNDQQPDIFFSNYRLRPSFLFKNNKGSFSEEAGPRGVQGEYNPQQFYDETMKTHYGRHYGHATGSVWQDFNNDGNLDLWVSKLVHKYNGPAEGGYDYRGYLCDDSKIYKNTGAPDYRFEDMRKTSGIAPMPMGGPGVYRGDELWFHTTAADFDNDGLVDVHISQVYDLPYATTLLFKNQGNFQFQNISQNEKISLIDSRVAGWADLNNDGKMDLIVVGRESKGAEPKLRVFQNSAKNGNHYLKVKLVGTRSGKSPVTAQVRLIHANGLFLRQFEGTVGVQGQQNDPTLHFGLGRTHRIDRMEVSWPSGQKQVLKNIRANDTLTITEP